MFMCIYSVAMENKLFQRDRRNRGDISTNRGQTQTNNLCLKTRKDEKTNNSLQTHQKKQETQKYESYIKLTISGAPGGSLVVH